MDQHRANLNELNNVLRNIADNPTVISDVDFEENLKKVIASVEQLWKDALSGARGELSNLSFIILHGFVQLIDEHSFIMIPTS